MRAARNGRVGPPFFRRQQIGECMDARRQRVRPQDRQTQAERHHWSAEASMGAIIAAVTIAAIIIAGLSYMYASSQVAPRGIGVIGLSPGRGWPA
jgi:hypothetical protein